MKNQIVLALIQLRSIGRRTLIRQIPLAADTECSIENIQNILEKARTKHSRIPEPTPEELKDAIENSEKIIGDCGRLHIQIITYLDSVYPKLLKKCADPPAVLYALGDTGWLDSMDSVAIIGTREPSQYGARVAAKIGEAFSERQFADISGLAIGCDTGGHKGCLRGGGKTAAVLAGGLDSIYPASNRGLAAEILEKGGALLSEYPPFTEPVKAAFVERDRLQAALTPGVFVIETREQGGSFHAIKFAKEYGRILGCYRHPDPYASLPEGAGNRRLIAEGSAVPVGSDCELDLFCEMLKKKRLELTEGDKKPAPESFRQMTFEDIFLNQ